ncbi:MAG: polysaccharide deacetylase family protein [Lachnospiraceae bacterium]|nr:polysaccharide deacetylase family protein [Lachnospiraceae bacterium]
MTKNQLLQKRARRKRQEKLIKLSIPVAAVLVLFLLINAIAHRPHIGKKIRQQEPVVAEEMVSTDTVQQVAAGEGMTGSVGWNVNDLGWWYLTDENTMYANGWKTIEGQRYYFKENGYMATGWVNTGTVKDSFFDNSGILDTTKQQKLVTLTYDDGPSANTDGVLDALEKYGMKATFFVVGQQADYYTSQLQREYDLGMEIGNHSYDHPWLNSLSQDEIIEQLDHNDRILENRIGIRTKLMRPTGGGISANMLEVIDKPMIQWDVDTLDWEHKSADTTYERTMRLVQDGSIVLMHDLFSPAADSADRMISSLINEGYKIVTVSELAEAYGYDLQPAYQYLAFYPEGTDLNITKEQALEDARNKE